MELLVVLAVVIPSKYVDTKDFMKHQLYSLSQLCESYGATKCEVRRNDKTQRYCLKHDPNSSNEYYEQGCTEWTLWGKSK